jgi:hypothetical protein
METPGAQFFADSLKYYVKEYNGWKKLENDKLTDEDYEQIAIRCCPYCLPKDIRTFIRRAFRGAKGEITREYLDSLMFQPFHDTVDAPCIVDINRKPLQEKYNPDYHGRPSSMQRKRPRDETSGGN